jgi:bisphosphoglycerate-independent phosphoglycerate mutase (AlkP superfamily)
MRKRAHKMVAEVAKGIAREVFERSASIDNRFYAMFRSNKTGDHAANRFAELNWNNFVPQARQALEMLHDRDTTPEGTRVQIRDALVKDQLFDGRMFDGKHIRDVKPFN